MSTLGANGVSVERGGRTILATSSITARTGELLVLGWPKRKRQKHLVANSRGVVVSDNRLGHP